MTRAVIFDSDGMLVHGPRFSEKYITDHGISIKLMEPFFEGPFKDCLVGKADLREELTKGWLENWQWRGTVDELLNYWFAVGDRRDESVFSSVATLRGKGIVCLVATNQEKYRTAYLSNTFGYTAAFNKVYSSALIGHKKHEQEFFEHVMRDITASFAISDPKEVMFWDDDIDNVRGASDFGFDAHQFTGAEAYAETMRSMKLL